MRTAWTAVVKLCWCVVSLTIMHFSYSAKQQLASDLSKDITKRYCLQIKKKKDSGGKMVLLIHCRTSRSKLWSAALQQISWTCCIKTVSVLVKHSSIGLIIYERSLQISWHLLLLLLLLHLLHSPTFLYPVWSQSPFCDKNHKLNMAWVSLVCLLL